MRLAVLRRSGLIGLLSVSVIAAGCAQSSPSNSYYERQARAEGKTVDQVRAEHAHWVEKHDRPYVDRGWRDENDDEQAGLFALAGLGALAAVVLVLSIPVKTFDWFHGDRPGAAARMMEDANSADNRREGMNKLANFGFITHETFKKRVRQIAQYDPDQTVRATAVRTSNRARDAQASSIFVKSLSDKNEWVRLEAAKALANVPDLNAADPLLRLFGNKDENRDVRIAAADALKHYQTFAVVRALSASLNERDFGVSWQARRSLKYLTGRDFGFDESAWLSYFAGVDNK